MTRVKREHCFCEFLEHTLRGPRVYKHRLLHTLEPKGCCNYLKDRRTAKVTSTQALWVALMAEERSGKTKDDIKSFTPFVSVLRNADVYDWLVTLDLCDEQLLASVEGREAFTRPKQWETALVAKGCDYEFIHRMDALILPELSRWLRYEDTSAFSTLHRIFTFPKRLNLEVEDLRSVAFEKWLAIEKRSVDLPDVSEIKAVIDEWFPKARMEEFYAHFVPCHGPGAVMEGTGRATLVEKQFSLGLSQRQLYFLKKHGLEDTMGLNSSFARAMYEFSPYRLNEVCEVVFVPKSWKTYRTISKKPVTTMWLQQGVGACLDHWIKTNKTGISYWYRLDTSDVNNWLAAEGAVDGIYDTLDLSAASDTVLLDLVKRLFRDTLLYDALICLRSELCPRREDRQ
uniref:RNA-directed RNA polymerase n=1 Tax=Leviviridae sp. TaxID=2027243 RepID=A0A142D864_9VIRU|nr:replicase [Leviviridae sp.]